MPYPVICSLNGGVWTTFTAYILRESSTVVCAWIGLPITDAAKTAKANLQFAPIDFSCWFARQSARRYCEWEALSLVGRPWPLVSLAPILAPAHRETRQAFCRFIDAFSPGAGLTLAERY